VIVESHSIGLRRNSLKYAGPRVEVAKVSRTPGPQLFGSNIERAGDHNQRVILQVIRLNAPVTRAEIARDTGLTPSGVATITKRLLQEGFIVEAGRIRGARGQPAIKLVINPDSCFSIGLNVDRDHITLVVLDFVGRVRGRSSREITCAQPAVVRSFFQRSVGQLLLRAGIPRNRLVGVGVAFPRDIARAQLPDQPADHAAWTSERLDELIGDVLGVPVFTENDAAAAAIGEMQFGSGRQYRSFFYLHVTATLGGGLVAEGNYFGANGCSGEIGSLHVRNDAGRANQLQNVVSLSGLYSRLAEHGFRVATPRGLTRLEAAARAIVDGWIHESTEALVESFVAINCLINPEAILIGGRLPSALVDQLAASLNARMAAFAAEIPTLAPVARALTSDDAPAIGAAILPFSNRLLPARFTRLKTT
jgi:predicted NBD/HSP70 family sugar kinase